MNAPRHLENPLALGASRAHPREGDDTEVVDLGPELVVSVPVGVDCPIDGVRCSNDVLEISANDSVIRAVPLPLVGSAPVEWSRRGDVVTAIVRRTH